MTLTNLIAKIKSDFNPVFAHEDSLSYRRGKTIQLLTKAQWEEWFPEKKFVFDYINDIVKEK